MNSVLGILDALDQRQKKKYYLISILSFLTTILELLGLGLIFPIISAITNPETFLLYIKKIHYLSFLQELNYKILIQYIFVLSLIFYFLKMVVVIFISYIRSKLFFSLIASLSQTVFNGYMNQTLIFSVPQNSAYITRNIIDFPVLIVNHILNGFYIILFESIFIACVFGMFILINPIIGLFILAFISLFILIFYILNKQSLKNYGKKLNQQVVERLKITREAIEGIKEVKLFDKNNFFEKFFQKSNYRIAGITTILEIKQLIPKFLLEFLAVLFIFSSLIFLFNTGYDLKDIIPMITIIVAGLVKILPSTNKILSSIQRLRSNRATVQDLLIEMKKFKNIKNNSNVFKDFLDKIEIQNLDFSYNEANPILKNVNLIIKKNTIQGIKGKSGSGKTTLLNLISGFLNPKNGKILIDNKIISENVSNWQSLISYIPQKIFIIDDTIEKNICFNREENEIDYKRLNKILDIVKLKDFINESKNGLKTIIGERGANISAGQAQRVGLARALYKNAKLLILDESTSALDEKTENEILLDIDKIKKNCTIVLVSHSSKVLSFCENIFEIDK
jgi:ABC-type multidrug transport system fused ATPase/permease subunit